MQARVSLHVWGEDLGMPTEVCEKSIANPAPLHLDDTER